MLMQCDIDRSKTCDVLSILDSSVCGNVCESTHLPSIYVFFFLSFPFKCVNVCERGREIWNFVRNTKLKLDACLRRMNDGVNCGYVSKR